MRTWAIHRIPERPAAGFTLLEILVVMVLVGLIAGLVAPRLGSLYESLVLREQRENLLHQIEGLPYRAFHTGRAFRLGDPAAPVPLEDFEGWQLSSDRVIVVHANGMCTGGMLQLRHEDGEVWDYLLQPPYCKAEAVDVVE